MRAALSLFVLMSLSMVIVRIASVGYRQVNWPLLVESEYKYIHTPSLSPRYH
jgi:hypothetical protein